MGKDFFLFLAENVSNEKILVGHLAIFWVGGILLSHKVGLIAHKSASLTGKMRRGARP